MKHDSPPSNQKAHGQTLKPPLSATRDATRSLLNSGSKLLPTWASAAVSAITSTPNSCTKEEKQLPSLTQNGSTAKKQEQPSSNNKERVVTPAYAYKSPATKLLEIQEVHPPTPSRLISENSFVYPIAKNGGSIYSDSRDYYDKTGKMSLFASTAGEDEHFGTQTAGFDKGDDNKENKSENDGHPYSNKDDFISKQVAKSPWEEWEHVHDKLARRIESREIQKIEKRRQATVSFVDNHATGGSHTVPSSYASYNEEDFDFALVLKPNAEYSFWADRLDFRPEAGMVGDSYLPYTVRPEGEQMVAENSQTKTGDDIAGNEHVENQPNASHVRQLFSVKKSARSSVFDRAMDALTPPRSSSLVRRSNTKRILKKLGSSASSLKAPVDGEEATDSAQFNQGINSIGKTKVTPSSTQRRRWGNPALYGELSKSELRRAHLTSPPVVSCRKVTSLRVDPWAVSASSSKKRKTPNNTDELIDFQLLEKIPSQVVPRGITKRVRLSNFLDALKIGIVVRRHKPNAVAQYVKLFTDDGGDTILFQHVLPEDAKLALKEQAVRYNKNKRFKTSDAVADGRKLDDASRQNGMTGNNKIVLPDYLAAQNFREEQSRAGGISTALSNLATKMSYSGSFHVSDIVEVHPARKRDPFSNGTDEEAAQPQDNGTVSIRASKSFYSEINTFSVVLLPSRLSGMMQTDSNKRKCVEQWYYGEGSPHNFRYLDFEAETEGEYWLIFGGFLLLQRDASRGRFARERAMGVLSHVNKREMENHLEKKRREEQSKRKEIQANAGGPLKLAYAKITAFLGLEEDHDYNSNNLDKMRDIDVVALQNAHLSIPKFTTKFDRFAECSLPPPSDYFLGFGSSGTQIWGRLRQAGLETQRIYALDKQCVMIRVRCPKDRLHDVAEVLRLKLRTKGGSYEPFREEAMSIFERSSDSRQDSSFCILRSSDRQKIIDFIICSRIRDSGAELGENTKLGKEIQMRVPLHMPATLERLHDAWVTFWFYENWKGRDGRSMSVLPAADISNTRDQPSYGRPISPSSITSSAVLSERSDTAPPKKYERPPNLVIRLILGCFFQPLDSIQQYFGEGVAFYFAWQQHCAVHLVFLSLIGLAVCAVLFVNKTWDHPIRLAFSFFIMIWSFVVMVTWRQRQNYLAHRWGTLNYQEEETTRPQFFGSYKQDPISKEWTIHYPSWRRWMKYIISFSVVFAMTAGTTYVVMLVFSNRDNFLCHYDNNQMNNATVQFNLKHLFNVSADCANANSGTSSARNMDFRRWKINFQFPVVIALVLPLLNFVLMRLSVALTEFENYRTESEYRNQLIIKVFAFRFVCYFAALYWYSFKSVSIDTLPASEITEIIYTVAFMLMISLTVSHWWNLLLTIFLPHWFYRWRLYEHKKKVVNEIRMIERLQEEHTESQDADAALAEARDIKLANSKILLQQAQSHVWLETMLPEHISFHDYVYAVIQFAFVTCFSVMLPIAPLISLLNHVWSMRLDAYKLCKGRRRPIVQRAGGIGVWEHVLHIVTVIGVITNCALTAFTNEMFQSIRGKKDRILLLVVIVVFWEHLMLLIKYVMQSFVNPMPKSVIFSLKKDKYERDLKITNNARAKKKTEDHEILFQVLP